MHPEHTYTPHIYKVGPTDHRQTLREPTQTQRATASPCSPLWLTRMEVHYWEYIHTYVKGGSRQQLASLSLPSSRGKLLTATLSLPELALTDPLTPLAPRATSPTHWLHFRWSSLAHLYTRTHCSRCPMNTRALRLTVWVLLLHSDPHRHTHTHTQREQKCPGASHNGI